MDGIFVPAQPSQPLLSGSSHQLNEGVVFTRPSVLDDPSLAALVQFWIPNAKASVISYIMDILYPAVFDGTLPYKNQLNRAIYA